MWLYSKIKKYNFFSVFPLYVILYSLFFCSLFSIQASDSKEYPELEEGEKFVTKVKETVGSFKSEVFKDKNLFFLLGPSRAGKSTILNLLAGKNLSAKQRDECGLWQIAGARIIAYIGHGASETILPNYWDDNKGTLFFDSPGSNDTRGPEYDVARSHILRTVGQNAKNVKFAIVSSMDSIQQQDGRLTDTINQLKKFIPSFDVKDSVIIATKADSDLNETHVVNSLKRQGFSCFKGVIFHKPSQAGPINGSSITSSIYSAPSFPSNKDLFGVSLSDKTNTEISTLISNLNNTIIKNNVCGDFYQDFSKRCIELINTHLGSADDLRIKLSEVSIKGEKINTKQDIKIILEFTDELKNKNLSSRILFSRIINVLDYIQSVTDRPEDSIHSWTAHADISNNIKNAKRDIEELAKSPVPNTTGQHLTLQGFILGTKDIYDILYRDVIEANKKLRDDKKSNPLQKVPEKIEGVSEIKAYSLNSIFIDADINAPGVNLTLISPQWKVVGERTINLKGKEGAAHNIKKANNGISYGENGKDGSPGKPGLPGGHFYGKGEKFTNLSSLTINVSGGTGGKGQNGGNGAEGIGGGHGGLENVKKGKEFISRKKIETQGVSDYVEKGVKFLLTYNDKFREVYESYEPGKSGGNAGKGGVGGYGGQPGTIKPDSLKEKLTTLTDKGARGTNGSHGEPGLGGKNGPKYRGVYINEIIAPGLRGYAEQDPSVLITTTGTTAAATGGAVLGAQTIAQTVTKHVLADTSKVVMKEGAKVVVKTTTKEVFKEGAKVAVTRGTKVVAEGVLQNVAMQGGKAVVNVAAPSAVGALTGMAGGIVAQGGLSLVSSLLSSGWEEQPYLAQYDMGRSSLGEVPVSCNEAGIENSITNHSINESEKGKSYSTFVSEKEKDFSKYIIKF